jgi:hypothetical protein
VGLIPWFGGDVLASTYDLQTLRLVHPDGTHEVYAGTGATGFLDGPLLSATFNYPSGLLYTGGVLYVADLLNGAVRTIALGPTSQAARSWGQVKSLHR